MIKFLMVKNIKGLVDVLVPTYLHEDYIAECVESIFSQDYSSFLVHVFDDCSPDSTQEILTMLQAKWGDRLKVYRNPERLGSGSRSVIHHAPRLKGEFWAVLEGDDYWVAHDKLSKQVQLLRKSPQAVAVASKTEIRNALTGELSMVEPDVLEWNYFDLVLNSNRVRMYVHISSVLWRNFHPGQKTPYPRGHLRLNDMRSEITLMNETLRETKGSVVMYNEVTSVYRYTGKGIWSSLTREQQDQRNQDLNVLLAKRRPLWVKFLIFLGMTRKLQSRSLN
jgi:glycosyltransferase involved in cell wall biosynthesis